MRAVLTYFSICGRGEVARLVAAAGEVEFTDNALAPAFDETGGWNQALKYKEMGEALGFPGVLPLLEHDGMNIYQTTAIERYLAAISPKYAGLTPQQKAKDEMFLLLKSDINGTTESLLFKKIDGEALTAAMDKFYSLVEGLLPEGGAYVGMAKVASWRCHGRLPSAGQASSEGVRLPSALVRSDPSAQIPPRGRGRGARPCRLRRV